MLVGMIVRACTHTEASAETDTDRQTEREAWLSLKGSEKNPPAMAENGPALPQTSSLCFTASNRNPDRKDALDTCQQ